MIDQVKYSLDLGKTWCVAPLAFSLIMTYSNYHQVAVQLWYFDSCTWSDDLAGPHLPKILATWKEGQGWRQSHHDKPRFCTDLWEEVHQR